MEPSVAGPGVAHGTRRSLSFAVGGARLLAEVDRPPHGRALVLFVHGSGSGRTSPRNVAVADRLRVRGIATVLLDLLSESEARADERSSSFRFDLPLLTERVLGALAWVERTDGLRELPCGLFGASTGGAVALRAAAARPDRVGALVLRGARSDLAGPVVRRVRAPTLILVGERDPEIRRWNEATLLELGPIGRLEVIPGATHLFEEPGAIEEVGRRTADWFARHLIAR
jgi:putative phosphoribosyl transferase